MPISLCSFQNVIGSDTRGTWNSTGDVTGTSDKEGEDNYDIIEYLAAQPWCNGKVSMAGNSYLAITQWFAGATNPPHLACLAPWEGFSSKYDDVIRIGG
jgi:putative CocE/NonD family hydrolase